MAASCVLFGGRVSGFRPDLVFEAMYVFRYSSTVQLISRCPVVVTETSLH